MTLIDAYGRKHDYLRISVTDRCNLRCLYCMGEDGVEQLTHEDILSYEEILEVVEAGSELGIKKIRITGGEPLIRKGIVDFIARLKRIRGIEDLALTTNGMLLSRHAIALKQAGLDRVNISLDSLQKEKFLRITRCGDLDLVFKGIEAALQHGLKPVKINTVLMRGVNDEEIADFIKLAHRQELHVRFIEYMPIGDHDSKYSDHYQPLSTVLERATAIGLPLQPLETPRGAGPAESYALPGGLGTIGLIHPISKHFCDSCNRLRLTAEGHLKACLYWQEELSLRPALGNREALKELIKTALQAKKSEHQMAYSDGCSRVKPALMRGMSKTGG